jgi:5-methylcytosine-specific restriction protein A
MHRSSPNVGRKGQDAEVFEPGRVYPRGELHREWAGTTEVQRQGGILTPREVPLIIVVTGEEGSEFGYEDYWDDEGVFHYFGAGQEGDMQFARGNLALRDHAENGEDVHLFEQGPDGLRYRGQMVVGDWNWRDDVPDRNGTPRRAIVFDLVALDDELAAPVTPQDSAGTADPRWTIPLDELRSRSARTLGEAPTSTVAKRNVYQRSSDLKVYVLRRADGTCEGCAQPAPFVTVTGHPYLEPHHTRRLSDGGPDDYHHVIALCPACHRRVHHGMDGQIYNEELIAKLGAIEP